MKLVIITLLAIITAQMAIFTVCLNKKIDKLIEINTPEYINVVPEKVIVER